MNMLGDFLFSILSEKEKRLPFYLVGAGYNFKQDLDPHSRPDGYPHIQWIQVESGQGHVLIKGTNYTIKENQGMLLYPGDPHEYYSTKSPWIVHWLTFNGYHIKKVLALAGFKYSGVYTLIHPEIFSGKIHYALSILKSEDSLKGFESSALVYDFLITLMKYAYKENNESVAKSYSRLDEVFNYIKNHYSEVISINDIAAILNVTPQHLCLLFRKVLGQRPFEYLNIFRINKSKDILIHEPRERITSIARRIGFESASYFCSVFKKMEGISPGSFRELHYHRKI